VQHELSRGDVACVLAEAAITNAGVILPDEGFHAGLRRLASEAGTLLVLDETHTLVAGPGGLTARWALEPDVLVLGKSIANGFPLGAYGMTEAVAGVLGPPAGASFAEQLATGDRAVPGPPIGLPNRALGPGLGSPLVGTVVRVPGVPSHATTFVRAHTRIVVAPTPRAPTPPVGGTNVDRRDNHDLTVLHRQHRAGGFRRSRLAVNPYTQAFTRLEHLPVDLADAA